MKILVTGANGFVGRHMVQLLQQRGHAPILFDLNPPPEPTTAPTYAGDVCDIQCLERVIAESQPDGCIHLGGIAFVPIGWQNPQLVYQVNLIGTVNLLETFRKIRPKARVIMVSSGEIYGRYQAELPMREDDLMLPANPYAIAKQAADRHALVCSEHYKQPVLCARPDNHTGPGQSDLFVTAAFARQLAEISLDKKSPRMLVGNLENMRNFTDVRDVTRAYLMLLEKGVPGQAYNIASGSPQRIRFVLDALCDIAGVHPEIEVDPARYRPTDCLPTLDTSRIRREIGWFPEIPIEKTLRDIYAYLLQTCRDE